jgi:uncharacterized membrane protein
MHNPTIIQQEAVEKHRRSVIKSATYRVVSISTDALVAYFFTRNVALSAGIVLFVNGYSTVLYYLHERVWAHIHWGHDTPGSH